jgi:hypothetical protein
MAGKRSRKWLVTFTVTDAPERDEAFMTKAEIVDEVFKAGCTSAGIKVTGLKATREA